MSEGNTYVHAQYTCDYPYHVEADMAPVHTAATEDLEFDCDPTPRGLTMLPLPDTPGCCSASDFISPAPSAVPSRAVSPSLSPVLTPGLSHALLVHQPPLPLFCLNGIAASFRGRPGGALGLSLDLAPALADAMEEDEGYGLLGLRLGSPMLGGDAAGAPGGGGAGAAVGPSAGAASAAGGGAAGGDAGAAGAAWGPKAAPTPLAGRRCQPLPDCAAERVGHHPGQFGHPGASPDRGCELDQLVERFSQAVVSV